MQEGSGDAPASPPLHQPVTVFAAFTLPAPLSSETNGIESATILDSDDDSDATGPPEETPERETGTRQEADATDRTQEEKKPEQPERPERIALADETAEATEDEAAQDVDALKPDDGCSALPPPPVHDSEGSDDDGSSPHREKPKPPAGPSGKRPVVAAAKSKLLAFRSFSRDKKSGDPATPKGSLPSPGEHHRPADGNAWEEAGTEHKEKGKARWKKFWK